MMRGWFGVALYEPKIEANLGIVIRSSHVFGAAFVALIGARYREVSTDTTKAQRHLPILYFRDWSLFTETMRHYPLIGVEVGKGLPLQKFCHPEQAIYVFGGEDRTLPVRCDIECHLQTRYCLNLGTVVGITLYARQAA